MAPKGNQNAKGCTWNGRPKTHDIKKIAQDLVEWSLLPTSLKFTQFAGPRLLNLQRFPEWEDKDLDFADAYAIAKQNLDVNRFAALTAEVLHSSTYNKSEGLYDPITRRYDREEKTFDASLRKQEDSKPTEVIVRVDGGGIGSGSGVSTKRISTSVHKGAK